MRPIIILSVLIASVCGSVSQTLIHSGKDAGLERQASHSSSQNLAGSLHEGKTTFDGFKEVIVDEKSYRVALCGREGLKAAEWHPDASHTAGWHDGFELFSYQTPLKNDSETPLHYFVAFPFEISTKKLILKPQEEGSLKISPKTPWVVITDDPKAPLDLEVYRKAIQQFQQTEPRLITGPGILVMRPKKT
ncbi:hypothetical protein PTTG_28466, partial [Puccinia triticina 1-1 BBBD Race 1]